MKATREHINKAQLKRQSQQEKYRLFGLTMPYLIMVFFLIIIPIEWFFYMSLVGRDGTLSMDNYTRMLKSKAYLRIFLTTFKISFLTTLICAVLGFISIFYVATFKPLGKYLYDWGVNSVLNQPTCANIRMVGVVAKKRLGKHFDARYWLNIWANKICAQYVRNFNRYGAYHAPVFDIAALCEHEGHR
jgi:ABC-type sulfate transport system permease component